MKGISRTDESGQGNRVQKCHNLQGITLKHRTQNWCLAFPRSAKGDDFRWGQLGHRTRQPWNTWVPFIKHLSPSCSSTACEMSSTTKERRSRLLHLLHTLRLDPTVHSFHGSRSHTLRQAYFGKFTKIQPRRYSCLAPVCPPVTGTKT